MSSFPPPGPFPGVRIFLRYAGARCSPSGASSNGKKRLISLGARESFLKDAALIASSTIGQDWGTDAYTRLYTHSSASYWQGGYLQIHFVLLDIQKDCVPLPQVQIRLFGFFQKTVRKSNSPSRPIRTISCVTLHAVSSATGRRGPSKGPKRCQHHRM